MFFLQSNFHVFVIHEAGVHLSRGERLLYNRDPDHHMSSLWDYIESLRCCLVIQSLFQIFVRSRMCLAPCLPWSDPFLKPMKSEGPDTMSLWVFYGKPEAWRDVQIAVDSMY